MKKYDCGYNKFGSVIANSDAKLKTQCVKSGEIPSQLRSDIKGQKHRGSFNIVVLFFDTKMAENDSTTCREDEEDFTTIPSLLTFFRSNYPVICASVSHSDVTVMSVILPDDVADDLSGFSSLFLMF